MEGLPDPRTDGELLVATRSDPEAFGVFPAGMCAGWFRSSAAGWPAPSWPSTCAPGRSPPPWRPRPATSRATSRPRGWLYGIAWNKLHDCQRRGRADDSTRRALGMAPIVVTDAGLERIEALTGGEALQLLEALPAEQREAVRARVIEQRGYGEIAAELRCSESVVRKRASRGVRAIRARMEVLWCLTTRLRRWRGSWWPRRAGAPAGHLAYVPAR